MSYYAENKLKARTINTQPTMTDQAGARDTDINVIVGKFAITGRVPGSSTEPLSGDFSNLPTDLAGFIHSARNLKRLQRELPEPLRKLPMEKLLTLTNTELTNILTPPAPTPADPPKEPSK